MSPSLRHIRYNELQDLLALYRQLHPDDPPVEQDKYLHALWQDIYNDPDLHYLVIENNGQIVCSCTLAVIKNLTRNLRPYGLIENVITHTDHRNHGYGTAVLHEAIRIARENNCYKIMLLTSSKKEETLCFYEHSGFDRKGKTGFVIYFK
jgi:GNAT superfamily N-acetyltransferase